jgi:hypothetical protein
MSCPFIGVGSVSSPLFRGFWYLRLRLECIRFGAAPSSFCHRQQGAVLVCLRLCRESADLGHQVLSVGYLQVLGACGGALWLWRASRRAQFWRR